MQVHFSIDNKLNILYNITIMVKAKRFAINPAPIVGILTAAVILGLLNAQLLVARAMAYVTPAQQDTQVEYSLQSSTVDSNQKNMVVPAISLNAPVVYGMNKVDEESVQHALEGGILHFGGSPLPGQPGNSVFVGHSSNQPWAQGDYKFVFMMLDKLKQGDKIYLAHSGTIFTYEVTETVVVKPNDVSVLEGSQTPTATFITCTPLGTNTNRLVVKAKQISPNNLSQDVQGLTRSAPELNSSLPGEGYSTLESLAN